MSRSGNDWTSEDDETIRTMAAANASAFLIAAKIKRTLSSVKRRAMAMGIKIRTTTAHRAAMKRAMDERDSQDRARQRQ